MFYTEIGIKSFVGQDEHTDTLENLGIKGINATRLFPNRTIGAASHRYNSSRFVCVGEPSIEKEWHLRVRAIETKYKGCRFRSRLEARWAVFFDALGIKWWYEPEGFHLRFDYERFAEAWETDPFIRRPDEDISSQIYKQFDGKEYWYLPDFYLPDLHYWLEIKGPNPTREEVGKAFMFNQMLAEDAFSKLKTAKTEAEEERAAENALRRGVFILYDDIPWPYPRKGNIFGYRDFMTRSSTTDRITRDLSDADVAHPYQTLLTGEINLCWQQCPLCSEIGISKMGVLYCPECPVRMGDRMMHLLVEEWNIGGSPAMQFASSSEILWEDAEELQEAYEAKERLINWEFFTSGHKTPKLQEAYAAARSARFGG